MTGHAALDVAAECGFGGDRVESLYEPTVSATRGVWRVRDGERAVVVKILQPVAADTVWGSSLSPDDPYYWRREADFYRSPLPSLLAGALPPPRALGVIDLDDGAVGLCLDDLTGYAVPGVWPLDACAAVATAAARLACTPAPEAADWLSRGWLRSYARRHDVDSELLDRLDAVPQRLCHFDLSAKNVFPGATPPRAIDWAFVGWGAIGTDAGGFALESALDFLLSPDDVGAVTERMHDEYVRVCRAEDPALDEDAIRFGLHASAAAKFAWIGPAVARASETMPATFNGIPAAEGIAIWRRCLPQLAAHTTAALRLAG
jgi:hypothetical protein